MQKHANHDIFTPERGFTLIEVMIAVAIVAIMSAIAYPSFERYIIKARVKGGENFLLELSVAQERYISTKRKYTDNLSQLGIVEVPASVQRDFEPPDIRVFNPDLTVAPSTTAGFTLENRKPAFNAVLTPRASGRLKGQMRIAIDSEGNKWMEASKTCGGTAGWTNRCCRGPDCSSAPSTIADPINYSCMKDATWVFWERNPDYNHNKVRTACP